MSVANIYLDSNAIVKRYVLEEESSIVDEIFDDAHRGIVRIGFSIWS